MVEMKLMLFLALIISLVAGSYLYWWLTQPILSEVNNKYFRRMFTQPALEQPNLSCLNTLVCYQHG